LTSASKIGAGKIHPLTSLRFFAALMIVFHHSIRGVAPGFPPGELGQRWLSTWSVSVSFFFFLSGYILSVVYLSNGEAVSKRKFWVARFARIYPLFLVTLVFDTPDVILWRIPVYGLRKALLFTGGTFLFDMTMLQAWVPRLRIICEPNWSLSVEALFYFLFPFIGPALWKLRGKGVWLTAAATYIVGLAITGAISQHLDTFSAGLFPPVHVPTFMLGILLARGQQEMKERPQGTRVRSRHVYGALLLALIGYTAIVANAGAHIPVIYIYNGILAPVFACVIWPLSSTQSLISRWLSVSWLVVLGEASYGLYLIHFPVWWYFYWITGMENVRIWFPLYLAICIGLSVLSFFFFETPTRKWLLHRFAVRPRESMEAASDAQ
jgi:peptidoglycan/LPS O-acetylase OafA/YrhL